jgi:hypothetical protein
MQIPEILMPIPNARSQMMAENIIAHFVCPKPVKPVLQCMRNSAPEPNGTDIGPATTDPTTTRIV